MSENGNGEAPDETPKPNEAPPPEGPPVSIIEFRDVDVVDGTYNISIRHEPPMREIREGHWAGTPAQIQAAEFFAEMVAQTQAEVEESPDANA